MKNDNKSIINEINKEYSFESKFTRKFKGSIWSTILFVILLFIFAFVYPGIDNFAKLSKLLWNLFNITIPMDIFCYIVLIISTIMTLIVLHLLNNILLKIVMKKKKITVNKDYEKWNAFVNFLAMEPEENLNDIQKNAQRAFWYESEVQNGGHVQYFVNTNLDDYTDVINSLEAIGAKDHAELLYKAMKIYFESDKAQIGNSEDVNDFISKSLEEKYQNLDSEYHSIQPDMNHYLRKYLEKYQDEFNR